MSVLLKNATYIDWKTLEFSVRNILAEEKKNSVSFAFAGLLSYHRDNRIRDDSDNVVMLTGSGLKDLKAVSGIIRMPRSIYPSVDELRSLFP